MHTSLSTTSGLLSLPVEVGRYIWEEIQIEETLGALSTTCKVFQHISQYFLFRKLVLSFPFPEADDIESRISHICERLGGLSTHRRLLTYIREMEICAYSKKRRYMAISPFPVSAQSVLADCIEGMTSIKALYLRQTIIAPVIARAIVQASARQVTELRLDRCSFTIPTGTPAADRLRISNLEISIMNTLGGTSGDGSPNIQGPFLDNFVRAARLDVKSLNLNKNNSSYLSIFLDVHFPSLQSFILRTLLGNTVFNPSLYLAIHTFLHDHRSITRLTLLGGPTGAFQPFQPTCLPHLRELDSSSAIVQQLVPGRPVESITVWIDNPSPSLPALSALAKSTSVVKRLKVFVEQCGATWAEFIDLLETSTPKLQLLDVFHGPDFEQELEVSYYVRNGQPTVSLLTTVTGQVSRPDNVQFLEGTSTPAVADHQLSYSVHDQGL